MQISSISDMRIIQKLLEEKNLPANDIGQEHQEFYGYLDYGQLEAVGCLELYDSIALLRSVAVKHQGKGLGTRLVQDLLNIAGDKGIREIVLLTTTAPDFFVKFGFNAIERTETPIEIQKSTEFSDICPNTSVIMIKEI